MRKKRKIKKNVAADLDDLIDRTSGDEYVTGCYSNYYAPKPEKLYKYVKYSRALETVKGSYLHCGTVEYYRLKDETENKVHYVLVALLLYAVHYLLDTVLKISAELCACQQCTDIQLVNLAAFQSFWHITFLYHACQSPHQCSLAHTRLAHVQRVILIAAT